MWYASLSYYTCLYCVYVCVHTRVHACVYQMLHCHNLLEKVKKWKCLFNDSRNLLTWISFQACIHMHFSKVHAGLCQIWFNPFKSRNMADAKHKISCCHSNILIWWMLNTAGIGGSCTWSNNNIQQPRFNLSLITHQIKKHKTYIVVKSTGNHSQLREGGQSCYHMTLFVWIFSMPNKFMQPVIRIKNNID